MNREIKTLSASISHKLGCQIDCSDVVSLLLEDCTHHLFLFHVAIRNVDIPASFFKES